MPGPDAVRRPALLPLEEGKLAPQAQRASGVGHWLTGWAILRLRPAAVDPTPPNQQEVRVRSSRVAVCILTACLILSSFGSAQEVPLSSAPASAATVPRLIRIRGAVRDETGKPLNGNIGITFSLYRDENDQVAVWQENQNVQMDSGGRYSALLGATNDAGLPLEIFSAGEARWLGVRPEGQSEQPRILFLSVAYALKAADTDLLGGKPASAFVLADGQNSSAQPASEAGIGSGSSQSRPQVLVPGSGALPLLVSPQAACSSITSDGTAAGNQIARSEEHTSELQSRQYLHSFPTRRSSDLQVLVPVSGALPLLVSPQAACSSITSDGTAAGNQIA